jgi:hypothetical protein
MMARKRKKKRIKKNKNQQVQPESKEENQTEDATNETSTPVDFVEEKEDICVICHNDLLTDLSQITRVKSCAHVFCYTCIKTWSTQYASKCPLCKVKITTLVREGLEDEHIKTIDVRSDDSEQPETRTTGPLDCLDHNYFLSEVELLLGEAKRALSAMERTQSSFNSNYRINSRHKSGYQQRFALVQEAKMELTHMKTEFMMRREFDPFYTLSQLYKIQDKINDNSHNNVMSYEDEDDDENYYDDYYDEDDELERTYVRYADNYY